jgi:hypothetical protein
MRVYPQKKGGDALPPLFFVLLFSVCAGSRERERAGETKTKQNTNGWGGWGEGDKRSSNGTEEGDQGVEVRGEEKKEGLR